jgi:glutaredoxin
MTMEIYVTPTCAWSNKLKAWLKSKKINYEEKDTSESQNGIFRDELLEKTNQLSTPVIDINGKIIIGFDEKAIETALNKNE